MKITDYMILSDGEANLTDLVRQYMNEGWQPHGSPLVFGLGRQQAMVKYEEPALLYGNSQSFEDPLGKLVSPKDPPPTCTNHMLGLRRIPREGYLAIYASNLPDDWPATFDTKFTYCPICGTKL